MGYSKRRNYLACGDGLAHRNPRHKGSNLPIETATTLMPTKAYGVPLIPINALTGELQMTDAIHTSPAPQSSSPATVADSRTPPVLRTRKQIQAASLADQAATRAAWKRSIPLARENWSKLDPAELSTVNGNVHKLAGLVQLRYHVTREDADEQVAKFLARSV